MVLSTRIPSKHTGKSTNMNILERTAFLNHNFRASRQKSLAATCMGQAGNGRRQDPSRRSNPVLESRKRPPVRSPRPQVPREEAIFTGTGISPQVPPQLPSQDLLQEVIRFIQCKFLL